jgi:hypothetical protein
MAVLGLLLLLSAAGITLDVVWQNTASISVDAVGQGFSLSSGWLFAAGVAAGAIGLLGMIMLMGGMARARRRRAALVESTSSVEGLQAERDRLAVQLERERAGRTSTRSTPWKQSRNERVDESGVIDLGDERSGEADSPDYAAVPSAAGRERATDRDEPVGSGRHSFFHRRH